MALQDLLHACEVGKFDIVKHILKKENIDIPNGTETPLHICAKKGFVKIGRLLIRKGMSIYKRDNKTNSPLHYAVMHGQIDFVRLLLKNNCDVNIKGFQNKTPLAYACIHGHPKIVKILLSKGASNAQDDTKTTPFQYGIHHNYRQCPQVISEFHTFYPNKPLSFFLEGDSKTKYYDYIIESDELLDVVLTYWPDFVWTAISKAPVNVIRSTLEKEWDKNYINTAASPVAAWSYTPNGTQTVNVTPLHAICYRYHMYLPQNEGPVSWKYQYTDHVSELDDIIKMLIQKGADVNSKGEDKETPLLALCRLLKPISRDVVHMLIGAGVDANSPDTLGITPLMLALTQCNFPVIFSLLEAGARVNEQINIPDGDSLTLPWYDVVLGDIQTGRSFHSEMLSSVTSIILNLIGKGELTDDIIQVFVWLLSAGLDIKVGDINSTLAEKLWIVMENHITSDLNYVFVDVLIESGNYSNISKYIKTKQNDHISAKCGKILSLKQIASNIIRKILQPNAWVSISKLELPSYIKKFITFGDHVCTVEKCPLALDTSIQFEMDMAEREESYLEGGAEAYFPDDYSLADYDDYYQRYDSLEEYFDGDELDDIYWGDRDFDGHSDGSGHFFPY